MRSQRIVLGSAAILGAALFATMLYSLARILNASGESAAAPLLADSETPAPTASLTADARSLGATPEATMSSSTGAPTPHPGAASAATPASPAPASPGTAVPSPPAAPAAGITTQPLPTGTPRPPGTPITSTSSSGGAVAVVPTPAPTSTQAASARLGPTSRGVEALRFVKEVDADTFIVLHEEDLWLVDHEAACFTANLAPGASVFIFSPDGFPSGDARIVLPDRARDCPVTATTPI
jgi:hypothetical protein